jgi:hypothetical protein
MKRALLYILLEFIDPRRLIRRPAAAREKLQWPAIDPSLLPEKVKKLRPLPADGDGIYWRRNANGSMTASNHPFTKECA